MILRSAWLAAMLATVSVAAAGLDIRTENLELGPDSLPQPGVPSGELLGPFEFHSSIIVDTVRRYWVFVPAQYDPAEAANVLVFQDGQRATVPGGSLSVPQVLANLAHDGSIPPTIGIFITPGNRTDESPHYPDDLGMSNPNHRWQEYDVLTDDYGRMIIEEILPLVGRDYHLTDDPTRRAIGGTSSGAICAFTVAWRHPEAFRNVISFIGSYVSIGARPPADDPAGRWSKGGHEYPALIRRAPIKPLTIFFQDGSNDLDNRWGNWFLANQQMVAALQYANRVADEREDPGPRYRVEHVWTNGAHSDAHGGAVLPEALRWIWAAGRK